MSTRPESSISNIIFTVESGGVLNGRLRVPGDKSVSHRSIMLGSLAEGTTHISGFLEGEDSLATLKAFRQMGVEIEGPNNGRVTIHGVGMHGLIAPDGPLDLGNSGTSMRLLSGLLAGQKFHCVLTGDASLSSRPMRRVTEPLSQMGVSIGTTDKGTAPLDIPGNQSLHHGCSQCAGEVVSLTGRYVRRRAHLRDRAGTHPGSYRTYVERFWVSSDT
jgi:5-enolpyruvylshikimate-3-phosphate synthase